MGNQQLVTSSDLRFQKSFGISQAEPLISEALFNRAWHRSVELTRLPSYSNDHSLYRRSFFWFCRHILWLPNGVRDSNVNCLSRFVLPFCFCFDANLNMVVSRKGTRHFVLPLLVQHRHKKAKSLV